MWRWIAAVTVLVGTFGLGMWSAFCMGSSRPSIDIVWEADDSLQRVGVDFDCTEAGVPTFRCIGVDADGHEMGVPMDHCDKCPAASNEPNRICTVEVEACPNQLPEDVQRVMEIARSRPSAAAGTMFDDPSNDVVFVEALTEVAEQTQKKTLPAVEGDACPLATSGGCPLAVNDATVCATTTCGSDGCEASACELTASVKSCPPCDSTCHATACDGETCAAGACESTCSQTASTNSGTTAGEVMGYLYERSRELDAKAWQLEEAGEYALADRLREIANEMRNSARVARASATALR